MGICPATSLHEMFSLRELSLIGHAHSRSQAAARRAGGEDKPQELYEAGTDYFGTAAVISLVKLRHSNLTQTACSIQLYLFYLLLVEKVGITLFLIFQFLSAFFNASKYNIVKFKIFNCFFYRKCTFFCALY